MAWALKALHATQQLVSCAHAELPGQVHVRCLGLMRSVGSRPFLVFHTSHERAHRDSSVLPQDVHLLYPTYWDFIDHASSNVT